jgi:branched-subunit amino acid aminotransferase/4-amino-4-deoxychorismate lyase
VFGFRISDFGFRIFLVSEPLVYLNGRMVPASEAHLAIYDLGVVLGATVAEQTRTFHQRLYRLDDHLDRLFHSVHYLGIDLGPSRGDLAAMSHELTAHNARFLNDNGELGLVHFVTAGEYSGYAGTAGMPVRQGPTFCAHTYRLPLERWARPMQAGARLVTPSVRHVPAQCWDPQIKCRSRMHFYLADREARSIDADAWALLQDLAGNLTETPTANFLLIEDGTMVSPPAANILPGISRAVAIELARRHGIPFTECDITVPAALAADEALLTSTPYCLLPVTHINGAAIGGGKPGPVFRQLLAAWSAEVGVDISRQICERARRIQ